MTTDNRERDGHKTLWRWRLLRQAEIFQFLTAVRPHMRVKHDRADEVIAAIAATLPAYTL